MKNTVYWATSATDQPSDLWPNHIAFSGRMGWIEWTGFWRNSDCRTHGLPILSPSK